MSDQEEELGSVRRLLLSLMLVAFAGGENGAEQFGMDQLRPVARFLQSQNSVSLVAECSRKLRSSARSSSSLPASAKTLALTTSRRCCPA